MKYKYPKYNQYRAMLDQLENKQNLVGCEVGVAEGYNLKRMLKHLDIETLYAVDISFKNCKTKDERIKRVIGDSIKVSNQFTDGSLDFVYLDSDHSYEHIKKEIQLYTPKVKKGGLFGGHDFNIKEVARAVLESFDFDVINTFNHTFHCDWWVEKW